MRAKSYRAILILAVLSLVFGLACLNYTRAEGLDHHRAFARSNNLPEPGPVIFFSGVAFVIIGSGAAGFAIGRGRAIKAAISTR